MANRVAKITISLPAELLGDIDGLAAESGESRSFVMREAALRYVTLKRDADAAAMRRRRVDRAMELMQGIRHMSAFDDRPSLEILRELRDDDGFGEPTAPDVKPDGGQDE